MNTVTVPNTALRVSPLCLGTGEIGTRIDRDHSFRLLDAFVEQGGNFLDTAHNYGDWVRDVERSISEKTIGAWLTARGVRDQIVLATKGAHWFLDTPHRLRLSPEEITRDLDESLDYLQTDRIDLYWLHRDDPARPVEGIMDTLRAQIEADKVRHVGASNWNIERIRAAQIYAQSQGWQGFVGDQVLWNAAALAKYPYGDSTVGFMDPERFAYHQETGMAAIPFQPQAYGLFNRMHNGTLEQMNPGFRSLYRLEESRERYGRMVEIMRQTDLTLTQILLGYLLSQPFPTIPIVGCQNIAQLTDSMAAADVRLTPEQVQYIGPAAQSLPGESAAD